MRFVTIGLAVFLSSLFDSAGGSSGSGSEATRTRRFESGDQANELTPAFISVSRLASPPPRGSKKTWFLSPSRPDRNAIHFPSGENFGLVSALGDVVSRTASPPAKGIR